MTTIFLSHSTKDNAAAGELKSWLEVKPRNHSVFLDFDPEAGIKGGADWEQTLYERLRTCRVVIPLLTQDWLSSKWCFAEVVHARSSGKVIVPLKVAACDALDVFPAIQQIDLTHNAEEGYRRLERALREVFPWDESRPPYPGLLAFQEDDAAIFFGRAPEISNAIETLESMRRRGSAGPQFALVLGASGSGKSSLALAGVVPRLRNRDGWLPVPAFHPREDPFSELAAAIAQAYERAQRPRDYSKIYDELNEAAGKQHPDGGVLLGIARDLSIKAQRGDATVLLVIDQAEELFGESVGEQANRFLSLIRATLERSDSRLMAMATMRSEFLGAFQTHPFLLDSPYPGPFAYQKITVDPLPVDRFTEIIRGPADLVSLAIDDELVDRIVKDTGTRDALPLLAYTLGRLWDNEAYRADSRFEMREYEELGGLDGSIRKAANEALGVCDLQPNQVEALRAAFVPAMVRIGADGARVRRRAYIDDLPRIAEKPLQRFIDAHLLVTDRDRDNRKTVEVAHEALLRVWPQLDAWLEEDQDKLRLLESVRGAAKDWQRGDRVPDLLVHRGDRLAEALVLVREPRFSLRPGSVQAEYLKGCESAQREREDAEREERERRVHDAERIAEEQKKTARRTRIGFVVAAVLCIAAIAVGWIAWKNASEAKRQTLEANYNLAKVFEEKALQALEDARKDRDVGDYKLAWLNTVAAMRQEIESEDIALRMKSISALLAPESVKAGFAEKLFFPSVNFHKGAVISVCFSPDGKILASSGSDDNTIRLWDVASGDSLRELKGHFRPVTSVCFSPDGKILASSGSDDNTIRLWDVASGDSLRELKGHSGTVFSVCFSPDGKTLASGSDDRTIGLWDVASGDSLRELKGHSGTVFSVCFSPDGKTLASGSRDRTIRLWDVASGDSLRELKGHSASVNSVSFSPDGKTLASGSRDRTIGLWDVASGDSLRELKGHSASVNSVSFSPDGKTLASGSWDRTIGLWDVASGDSLHELKGHSASVNSVSFSPDGKILASGSDDRTIRLWDVASGDSLHELKGHSASVTSVSFSPDGKILASGSDDRTIRLWDVASGDSLHELKGHFRPVTSVSFSPDGKTLASGSRDRTIRLWDVASGDRLRELKGHFRPVTSVSFSPDGKTLASSGLHDRTIRLWDVASGDSLRELKGHFRVTSVSFSPDGKTLASGSDDRTIGLWDVASGDSLRKLKGHSASVNSVSFSPDGKILASGSDDRTIRLWDVASGDSLRELKGHSGTVFSVCFSPDGKTLASSGLDDRTIRLWDMASGDSLRELKGHSSAVFSVYFSPDGKTLASGSGDRTIRLWDVASGDSLRELKGHFRPVTSVSFSPDGKTLASGSRDRTIRLWDVASGDSLRELKGHIGDVTSVSFSPDGEILASGSGDVTIRLWDVASGDSLRELKGHSAFVNSVSFSPDGKTLASGSSDNTIRLWDVSSGDSLRELDHSAVFRVSFSPDGETMASKSWDNTIRLWDVTSGESLHEFKGHSSAVNSVSFSPDGETMASGSWDNSIGLWDVASGESLRELKGHSSAVTSVCFSPDGKTLASGSDDNTIRLWDVASGESLRELKGHSGTVFSVCFSPDGKTLASGSDDNTIRLWDISSYFIFLKDGEPTSLFYAFAEGVRFFWQVRQEGLEFKRHVTPTLYPQKGYHFKYDPKFRPLLNPPALGQGKFDQILEWAKGQVAEENE